MKDYEVQKYIVFADGQVITFGDRTIHAHKAREYSANPVGAGFYCEHNGRIRVFGDSESLGLPSAPEHAKMIEAHLEAKRLNAFLREAK